MIFSLIQDVADALAAMPALHSRRRILALLDEALRRDVHFIDRHPTTLFQCLWNSCWWYDCPDRHEHDEHPGAVPAKEINAAPVQAPAPGAMQRLFSRVHAFFGGAAPPQPAPAAAAPDVA